MGAEEQAVVPDKHAEREAKRQAKREERALRKASRPKIRKWRGLLAGKELRVRLLVFAFIVIVMASLSFVQLGFVGVGLPGNYNAYCITLLAPVALAALLFGMPLGTLGGLIAGCIMFAHAQLQPLDYYEINFITPLSSIALFTLFGFFLSFLFAVALRNNPTPVRRFVYTLIVCVVVSSLFTTGFNLVVLVELVSYTLNFMLEAGMAADSDFLVTQVFLALSHMGDAGIQILVDAALMVVLCSIAEFAVARMQMTGENRGIRTTFREWLLVVVATVFMVTMALSFVVITDQSKQQAQREMAAEVDYLKDQLMAHDERIEGLTSFLSKDASSVQGIDESEEQDLKSLLSIDNLLDGYTKQTDGLIFIAKDDTVILSDDDLVKPGQSYIDVLISRVISTEYSGPNFFQIAFDGSESDFENMLSDGKIETDEASSLVNRRIMTQMAFMYSDSINDYDIAIVRSAPVVFAGRTSVMAWTTLTAFILLLAVFLMASKLLTRVVVRRIDETNGVLAEITGGNLDARVDIRDSREFKSLSNGINTTVGTLKDWIAEAETRMDQELATAKAIQESALPQIFPPFPDIMRFDVYASMKPAREVGGDFYDFFLVGDDSDSEAGKLGFVIADVSGKGVPAALFMMAAKTEVRNYLESGVEPGEALENANRQLCEGNEAGMFVTVFAGLLDYATGHVLYANAGHNPPLIWQDGSWRWLKDISGMPLGLFDGFPYDTFELDMKIGDQFLLYTDGVTEAMSVDGELYGEERLAALVDENFTSHPRSLVNCVRRELVSYTRGAEQSDDITMLALEYGVPPEVTASLVVPADIDELPRVNDFIHTELNRRLCPLKVQNQLDIALEELFVNVARYAYPDATPENPGRVRVSYTYSADPPSVRVELADNGVPYNPLAKPDAVTPDDIMEVPIGGLGILMAKRSVDEMTYDYVDGSNVVSFVKKW